MILDTALDRVIRWRGERRVLQQYAVLFGVRWHRLDTNTQARARINAHLKPYGSSVDERRWGAILWPVKR